MPILRPRQKHFVERSLAALKEHANTLGVAPTGAGKTYMLSGLIGQWLDGSDAKACVLAHRDELTAQNCTKFQRLNPSISTSVFDATQKNWSGQTTFAMVPSLARQNHLDHMPTIDLLVIDEAHHAMATSYRRIIDQAYRNNPQLKLYGLTATPVRGDRRGLRPVFSNVADQIHIGEIIRDGHLVAPRTFVIDVGTQQQLCDVKRTANDFDMAAVADIMDKTVINEAVVKHWQAEAGERKTIVFCSTVSHALHTCESFVDAGVRAAVIHGDLSRSERQRLLEQFDRGDLQVLLNCFVLTEGFDSQPVSCVVLLRPSSQQSTYIQMIGRGLRTVDPNEYPGVTKTDCIVLDFGTSTLMHGSLEQAVDLDGDEHSGKAPHKQCPDCQASVPNACRECPLCAYAWTVTPSDKTGDDSVLTDFVMSEVDLLKRSSFRWCDLFNDDNALMATGFEAWAGVFFLNGEWYALGGTKKQQTRLLAVGERTIGLAAADDWLNEYETEEAARKSRRWLSQAVTPQQCRYLPKAYRNHYGLTRYHASCLLAFQFNKRDIQSCVFNAAKRQEAA